jgi:hypothetical protein
MVLQKGILGMKWKTALLLCSGIIILKMTSYAIDTGSSNTSGFLGENGAIPIGSSMEYVGENKFTEGIISAYQQMQYDLYNTLERYMLHDQIFVGQIGDFVRNMTTYGEP